MSVGSAWTWDLRGARRALVFAGLSLALALLLTATTDEGDVAWLVRVGRTWPVAPVCAGVGVWASLAGVRARSERLALEALGRSPRRNAAGPVAAGLLVSLLAGALLVACPRIDLQGFFPTMARGSDWTFDGSDFVDHTRGIRVTKDGASVASGTTATVQQEEASGPGAAGRSVAAAVTALTGGALTLLAASVRRTERKDGGTTLRFAAAVLLAILPTIFLFHAAAAAASRSSRGIVLTAAIVPALSLLAYAATKFRADS
ncbi:hypothetical protein LZC95_20715 [Pendulispora brunnea]|uniref:Integral membrane protein n=1 Tax=Pendulispora brunnea TaxID=2905690 RepID=A0ABZ2KPI8_9BACT